MIDNNDTIAAIATPPGRGGIGIIRISGPRSLSIASALTGKKPPARRVVFCSFKDVNDVVIDKGIVLYFSAPGSYTGEDVVELQGHGGQAVLNALLGETLRLGARMARPGEFTERAFLNEKLDLLQAEAVADLIDSSSGQAARSAMRSLNGEFSVGIDDLLKELVNIRVFVEGALDFSEEDVVKLSGSDIEKRTTNCLQKLETILLKARNGLALREGFSVAIIGPPNVGKSSLLNVLSQTNRAIVTPIPGTTRDVIEEKILLDGLPMNVVDTAGIRDTNDSIEEEGISRAWAAAEKADLVLLVVEAQPAYQQYEDTIDSRIPIGTKRIIIHNKIDLLDMQAKIMSRIADRPEVYLSVKTQQGLNLLTEQIKQVMGITDTEEDVLPARTRHIEALEQARELLQKGREKIKSPKPAAELIAEDLHQAQNRLEAITGKSTPDDLLGEIFSSFCIGK